MKKAELRLILLVAFLILFKIAESQTVTASGHAFLEFQEFHNNIKVKFERIAPSLLSDSTFTDSTGYYNIELEGGIYRVNFSKAEYIDLQAPDIPIYNDTTLMERTLESIGLSGELTGQLSSGVYKVGGDIYIPVNEVLIIKPGVILQFMQDVKFEVFGTLKAEGAHEDSIRFTHYKINQFWKGIDFKKNSSNNSVLNYCIIEFSDDRGISVFKSSPDIFNSTIQYNTHQSFTDGQDEVSGGGAGISLKYSNSIIKNVTVRNNTGVTLGCGIYCSDGNPHISNSIIINNVNPRIWSSGSVRPGGGVYCAYEAKLTIENTLICHNANSIGGGICASGFAGIIIPELTIVNCIIYENNASVEYGRGGGIATLNVTDLSVRNSLVWNNEGGNFSCDDPWLGVNVTVNNNMDPCDAYGNLIMDPMFVSPSLEDYNLNMESPCIDAGDNSLVTSETDFLHNFRIWDGNNDGDTIVDMGCYEYASQFNPVGIFKTLKPLAKSFIFPNPVHNNLSIKIGNISEIEIFDNVGKKVFTSNKEPVDASRLNPGFYIIKVQDKKGIFHSEKFLKY